MMIGVHIWTKVYSICYVVGGSLFGSNMSDGFDDDVVELSYLLTGGDRRGVSSSVLFSACKFKFFSCGLDFPLLIILFYLLF